MAYTRQQYIEKFGVDPETLGADKVKKTRVGSPTGGSLPVQPDPSKGFTLDELDAMPDSTPDPSKGFTLDELNAIPDTTNKQSFPMIDRIANRATASSENVQKGQGGGKDGNLTVFDSLNNLNNSITDVGRGIGKAAVRTVPNVVAALTPDAMWGENSILNSESDKAQRFNEAYSGKNAGQKFGATAFDIATILAGGEGAIAGATKVASKIPTIANAASKAGTLGKLTRGGTRVAGAIADNTLGSAIIGKGNPYDNAGEFAKDAGIATAVSTISPLAKFAKYTLPGGEARKLADSAEFAQKFVDDTVEGKASPFDTGRYEQSKVDFKDSFTKLIDDARGKKSETINRLIANGDRKLASTIEDFDSIPKEEIPGVLDTIFEQFGGIGKLKDGKVNVMSLIESPEFKDSLNTIGKLQDELTKSQDIKFNIPTMKEQVIKKLQSKSNDAVSDQKITDTVNDYFDRLALERGGQNVQSAELGLHDIFKSNQKLRSDFYKNGQPILDKGLKDIQRKIGGAVDEILFDPNVNPDGLQSKKLQQEYMKLKDAETVLKAMDGINPKGPFSNFVAQLVGSVGGYAMGGGPATSYVLGGLGGDVAKNLNKKASSLKFSDAIGKSSNSAISQVKNAKKLEDLKDTVKSIIDNNNFKGKQKIKAEKFLKDYLKNLDEASRLGLPEGQSTIQSNFMFDSGANRIRNSLKNSRKIPGDIVEINSAPNRPNLVRPSTDIALIPGVDYSPRKPGIIVPPGGFTRGTNRKQSLKDFLR